MSGELTNIRPAKTDGTGLYTQTNKIYYYDKSGNQKSVSFVYYAKNTTTSGLSLIWQRDHSSSNIFAADNDLLLIAYTPTKDIVLTSASVILSTSCTYNCVFDIYDSSYACLLNKSDITVTSTSITTSAGSITAYKHTATYSTGLTLSAGNTYYICITHLYTGGDVGTYYNSNKTGNYLVISNNYNWVLQQGNSLSTISPIAYTDKKFYLLINEEEV